MTELAAALLAAGVRPAVGSRWLIPHLTGYAEARIIEARGDVVLELVEYGTRVGCDLARWNRKVQAGEVWPSDEPAIEAVKQQREEMPVSGWEILNKASDGERAAT